jgi:hypothetical protein
MIPALCAVYYYSTEQSTELSDFTKITGISKMLKMSKNSCQSDTFIFNKRLDLLSENSLNLAGTFNSKEIFSLLYAVFHGMKNFPNKWHVTYALSPWRAVLTCPLWFVMAHVHHCVEKIKSGYTVFQALLGNVHTHAYVHTFIRIRVHFIKSIYIIVLCFIIMDVIVTLLYCIISYYIT